jgi:hypothetical protein
VSLAIHAIGVIPTDLVPEYELLEASNAEVKAGEDLRCSATMQIGTLLWG